MRPQATREANRNKGLAKFKAVSIALLVTALFVAWIAYFTDWQRIQPILLRTDLWALFAIAILALPIQWLRAQRFRLMLHDFETDSWRMFRVAGLLIVLNTLIPFRLGELSFPLLANRAFGISKAFGLGVLTFVRLFDLGVVILLLALLGLVVLDSSLFQLVSLLLVLGSCLGLGILLFFTKPIQQWLLQYLGTGRLGKLLERISAGAAALTNEVRFRFLIVSFAIWWLLATMSALAAMTILSNLHYIQGLFAAAATSIGFALPVNGVASLGPAQVAWAEALRLLAFDYELGIASALVVHFTVLVGIGYTAVAVSLISRKKTANLA